MAAQPDKLNYIIDSLADGDLTGNEAKSALNQLLLEARTAAVKELLGTGLYAERASYLHPQTPKNMNWSIVVQPVYIVPASVVSDLAKPDFYNNKDASNPPSEAGEK